MTFDAHVVSVLIASPTDTAAERDAIESALHRWNADRARAQGVILLPLRWEVNAVPVMADSPQAAINRQLLERSDIVIGVFFAKLGTATKDYPSGTVEEILEAHEQGKPVHVYFSAAPIPRDQLDAKQLAALAEVKKDLSSRALYGEFASSEDLKTQVRSAIEHDIAELGLANTPVSMGGNSATKPVVLAAEYMYDREQEIDRRGKIKYRNRNQRLVVTNHGSEVAHGVRVKLEPTDDGDLPIRLEELDKPRDVPPHGGTTSYALFMYAGSARQYTVTITWQGESGEEKISHSLSMR